MFLVAASTRAACTYCERSAVLSPRAAGHSRACRRQRRNARVGASARCARRSTPTCRPPPATSRVGPTRVRAKTSALSTGPSLSARGKPLHSTCLVATIRSPRAVFLESALRRPDQLCRTCRELGRESRPSPCKQAIRAFRFVGESSWTGAGPCWNGLAKPNLDMPSRSIIVYSAKCPVRHDLMSEYRGRSQIRELQNRAFHRKREEAVDECMRVHSARATEVTIQSGESLESTRTC